MSMVAFAATSPVAVAVAWIAIVPALVIVADAYAASCNGSLENTGSDRG